MNAPDRSDRLLKLMAYADGELEGADLAEVESWLAKEPDAVRFVNDLANLGDLASLGFAESADAKAANSFDVADAVMAKVASAGAAPKVASLAARARRSNSLRTVGGAVAAMALAASVLVMMRPKGDEPLARAPVSPTEPAASSGNSDNGGLGVDINVAESAEHSVSVIYLPSENTLTTSVVLWVDETGDKK